MPLRCTFALLFISITLGGCGPKADDDSVWVGCVASFTGRDGAAGVHLKQGVALAVEEAAGQRVEGRRMAVVLADDRGDGDAAEAEAVRLLSVNRVAALVGGLDHGRSPRLARAAQPYPTPVVLPCEVAGELPGDAVFTLGVRPAWRGRVLARYASGAVKAKHAAVLIDERNPIAGELASAFVREWPLSDETSAEQATFRTDDELRERTAHVAAARPDVVLIAAAPADFLKAQRQLDAAALHAPLLFGGEDVGAGPLAVAGGDVTTATVFARDELTDRGRGVAAKYQERFREAPDLPAVQGYDAARLLFDALVRAKTAAGDRVRDRLAASDFESLTGSLKFEDGRARRPLFVVGLRDGTAKVVQTIDPEPDVAPAGPH